MLNGIIQASLSASGNEPGHGVTQIGKDVDRPDGGRGGRSGRLHGGQHRGREGPGSVQEGPCKVRTWRSPGVRRMGWRGAVGKVG